MRHTDNVFFVLHCLILRAAAASFSNKLSLGKRSAAFFLPFEQKNPRLRLEKHFFRVILFLRKFQPERRMPYETSESSLGKKGNPASLHH